MKACWQWRLVRAGHYQLEHPTLTGVIDRCNSRRVWWAIWYDDVCTGWGREWDVSDAKKRAARLIDGVKLRG